MNRAATTMIPTTQIINTAPAPMVTIHSSIEIISDSLSTNTAISLLTTSPVESSTVTRMMCPPSLMFVVSTTQVNGEAVSSLTTDPSILSVADTIGSSTAAITLALMVMFPETVAELEGDVITSVGVLPVGTTPPPPE